MRKLILICVLAAVTMTGLIVHASTADTPSEKPAGPPARKSSPMVLEIDAMLGEQDARLEELYVELAAAPDPAAALAVQKRIEEVKRDSERSMLQIQLDHARVSGTPEQVEALERALADFDDPRPRRVPVNSTTGESGDAR